MASKKSLSRKFFAQSGTGAGTIIVWVGALSFCMFIFYGVVDWIVGVKTDRESLRQEQSARNAPGKPFIPKDQPGTQESY